jgi:membrane-bound acyltransferase YfiQ involved in biofilm formation
MTGKTILLILKIYILSDILYYVILNLAHEGWSKKNCRWPNGGDRIG